MPKHRAADVVIATGMTENGWVTVDPRTLETRYPNVYAVADLANTGAPKAGVFAEGAARIVATNVLAKLRGETPTARNPGVGSCYIELGAGRIACVDVDFFSGPKPTGTFHEQSEELRADKENFGKAAARGGSVADGAADGAPGPLAYPPKCLASLRKNRILLEGA